MFAPLRLLALAIMAVCTFLFATTSRADNGNYPSQPIRLIVPYSPGGGVDNIARRLADRLGSELGGSVVVENRPGGNNMVAVRALLSGKPDGYTIMLTTNGMMSIAPVVYTDSPFDPLKDFSFIGLVSEYPYVMVSGSGRFKSLEDLIKKAQSSEDGISMAYTGHVKSLSVDLFGMLIKAKTLKIPYKGDADGVNDMVAGRVDVGLFALSVAVPLIEAGKLDSLAVTSKARLKMLKDTSTMSEAGVKGFDSGVWTGIIAPAGVPEPVVATLQKALQKVQNDPSFREVFEHTGDTVLIGDHDQFRQKVQSDMKLWAGVMKNAGIKPIKMSK